MSLSSGDYSSSSIESINSWQAFIKRSDPIPIPGAKVYTKHYYLPKEKSVLSDNNNNQQRKFSSDFVDKNITSEIAIDKAIEIADDAFFFQSSGYMPPVTEPLKILKVAESPAFSFRSSFSFKF